MPRLGAHMSIAGGLPRAVDRAVLHGCEALQIFTKSAGQWRARPLPRAEVRDFRLRVEASGIAPVVAHASYLINAAARAEPLRSQSIASLGEELDRAEALGLMGLVLHPGACTGGSDAEGLQLIGDALATVLASRTGQRTQILLEHTAGQGTMLGWTFEQLAAVLSHVDGHPRVAVWLDTCHLLAAGYDIVTSRGYADTFRHFGRVIGFDRLRGFHVNDSKKPLGSRIDRHEHIGQGCLGREPFRRLLRDRRFVKLPMLIETEKLERSSRTQVTRDPLDEMNLNLLRELAGSRRRTPAAGRV